MRRDLRGLRKDVAEEVSQHLVAAGTLLEADPRRALAHARYARSKASRLAVVREAAGVAAYYAGEWAESIAELRAARRMGGGPGHLAVLADAERALGRPERALEISRGPEAAELGRDEAIELLIVASGARRDLGELDAAVVALQVPELASDVVAPWTARLRYAYADALLSAGRREEAVRWFLRTVEVDDEELTDAGERLAELADDHDVVEASDVLEAEFAAVPGSADAVEPAAEPEPDDVADSGTAVHGDAGDNGDAGDAGDNGDAGNDGDDGSAVAAMSDGAMSDGAMSDGAVSDGAVADEVAADDRITEHPEPAERATGPAGNPDVPSR